MTSAQGLVSVEMPQIFTTPSVLQIPAMASVPHVARDMMAASTAMTVASILFNPFDVVKTKLQTQNQLNADASRRIYNSTLHCARRVRLEDGLLRGLWLPGLTASIMRDVVNGGVRMGGYASALQMWHEVVPWGAPRGEPRPAFATKLLAGMSTGAVGAVLANPMDVIKVRLQAESGSVQSGVYVTGLRQGQPPSPGFVVSAWRLARVEGIREGLFRGVGANCMRASLVTSGQLASYDQTKLLLAANAVGPLKDEKARIMAASAVAGLVAATVAAPVDLIRSRIMDDARCAGGSESKYNGTLDCIVKTVRAEGPFAMWKGWTPSYLRLGPHFMVSLPLLEFLRIHVFDLQAL